MKKTRTRIIRLLGLSALLAVSTLANTISFDTAFNTTGYSTHSVLAPPEWSISRAFVLQPDGKIIIAGDTYGGGSFAEKLALVRLHADGTIDTSFGTAGKTVTLITNATNASKMILQPDGKIIVCGWAYTDATRYDMVIARYTADGILDTSFNQTGYSVLNIQADSMDFGADVGVLPDGKIVMVGNTAALGQQRDHVLVRFNTDGTFDSTFNGTGILVLSNPADESMNRLIIQPGGKILLGGHRYNGTRHEFLLMRFNSDGTPDGSFGTAGTTRTDAGSNGSVITAMDLRPSDGKIIASGWGKMARYSADGLLDHTFGTSGVATMPSQFNPWNIRVLSNNKIIITASSGSGVTRLMPDGAIDYNFSGGLRYVNIPDHGCTFRDIIALDDGKLLLNGECTPNSGNILRFGVVKLRETTTKRFLDFTGDGTSDIALFRPSNTQWPYLNSTTLTAPAPLGPFGAATDIPVPADFTGDGRADVAVFRPSTGEWLVLRSENGTSYSIPFGMAGDIPVASDFDGDQVADYGVFRPSKGMWFIERSSAGFMTAWFGTAGDRPVPSDYDGDFKTDVAIYRPSVGEWWIHKSSDNGVFAYQFGNSSDVTVQGEYTGDNKTDVAFYRPVTGEWFVIRSEDNSYYSGPWGGVPGDVPIPGQYAGDPKFDYVIYRPSTSTWHILPNGGSYFFKIFGESGDQPLAPLLNP